MKLAIMQPYFFPYIGYWQLMNAVDKYVIYDDVNYIKRGWINRNRILVNGQIKYFNLPKLGGSQNQLIIDVKANNDPKTIQKNLHMIEAAYGKAPYYSEIYFIIKKVLECGKESIVGHILESFHLICNYLDIKTELILSSDIKKDCSLKAQEKILDICRILGASEYYNAIGGKDLYSAQDFKAQGIKLKFLRPIITPYKQFHDEFCPALSIIDVLMFNSRDEVIKMLEQYRVE